MRVHIFSDLHITGPEDPLYMAFLATLDSIKDVKDRVVLAGDIFDVLVGGGSFYKEKYPAFLGVIRNLASNGVQVHYIEGNHDFNLSPYFAGLSVNVEEDAVALSHGSKRLWIEHGDTIDANDHAYQAWRTVSRSVFLKEFSARMPGVVLQQVGQWWSRNTVKKEQDLPENWPEGKLHALRWMYRHYAEKKFHEGIDWVVLGHCHDFDDYTTVVENRNCHYMNMGYPRRHKSYVRADLDLGIIERIQFFREN